MVAVVAVVVVVGGGGLYITQMLALAPVMSSAQATRHVKLALKSTPAVLWIVPAGGACTSHPTLSSHVAWLDMPPADQVNATDCP